MKTSIPIMKVCYKGKKSEVLFQNSFCFSNILICIKTNNNYFCIAINNKTINVSYDELYICFGFSLCMYISLLMLI